MDTPDLGALGAALMATGEAPSAPASRGRARRGDAHPIACDVDGPHAAVAFAVFDPHPHLAPGWWTEVVAYEDRGAGWEPGSSADLNTTQHPFDRPAAITNSRIPWLDWPALGNGVERREQEPHQRRLIWGIAPTSTARLTLTTADGLSREITITPWCGAWIARVLGPTGTVTGYGHRGELLGRTVLPDP